MVVPRPRQTLRNDDYGLAAGNVWLTANGAKFDVRVDEASAECRRALTNIGKGMLGQSVDSPFSTSLGSCQQRAPKSPC